MCGVFNVLIVLFGGMNKDKKVFGDIWIFIFKEKKWFFFVEMLKKFRNEFVVDFFNFRVDVVLWCMQIKMMIYGGILENFVFLDDMWEYSLVDFIW